MSEQFTLPSYFNTTALKGSKLEQEQRNAESQDQIILGCFVRQSYCSPSEIYALRHVIGLGDVPITSIRRSITNLTKQGRLRKTLAKRNGMYGKFEHVWEINVFSG